MIDHGIHHLREGMIVRAGSLYRVVKLGPGPVVTLRPLRQWESLVHRLKTWWRYL